jgi:hypothetical protein
MIYLVLLVLLLPLGTWIGVIVVYSLSKDKDNEEVKSLEEDYYDNLHLYSETGFFTTIKKVQNYDKE